MSSMWALDLETTIFATVKYRALPIIKAQLPKVTDSNFTMNNIISSDAEFPTIYIHFLPSVELGQDLEGIALNGIRNTVQCEITVDAKNGMTVARFIGGVMMEQFKQLGYRINSLPEFNGNTTDTKRLIFRGTRVFGVNDTLF